MSIIISNELEKLQWRFIREDNKTTYKAHLISWKVCCVSKEQGDLDIKQP